MRRFNLKSSLLATVMLLIASCQTAQSQSSSAMEVPHSIRTVSSDGVQVYGYDFGSDLTSPSSLIVLFHQGVQRSRRVFRHCDLATG